MKIASVTFFGEKGMAGGGRTPAIAFKDWCDLLNIECDYINVFDGITAEELNEYDCLFFATPPYPADGSFDMRLIKTNFIFMLHGECDVEMYGKEKIAEMRMHPSCIGVVHVGNHNSELLWFPCCRPKDLWSGEIKPRKKTGLLYAARVFEMKNPVQFMKMANETLHITHNALMIGECKSNFLNRTLEAIKGGVNYWPHEFDEDVMLDKDFGFYWEVFGTLSRPVNSPRLNLSAVEAINNGMMPIVNPKSMPERMTQIFINTSINGKPNSLAESMIYYYKNKEERWEKINNIMSKGEYSFNSVIKQIEKIINVMEKNNG